MSTIWIGNEHGGYALKQTVVAELERRGIDVVDVRLYSTEMVRYPFHAATVAGTVSRGMIEEAEGSMCSGEPWQIDEPKFAPASGGR